MKWTALTKDDPIRATLPDNQRFHNCHVRYFGLGTRLYVMTNDPDFDRIDKIASQKIHPSKMVEQLSEIILGDFQLVTVDFEHLNGIGVWKGPKPENEAKTPNFVESNMFSSYLPKSCNLPIVKRRHLTVYDMKNGKPDYSKPIIWMVGESIYQKIMEVTKTFLETDDLIICRDGNQFIIQNRTCIS